MAKILNNARKKYGDPYNKTEYEEELEIYEKMEFKSVQERRARFSGHLEGVERNGSINVISDSDDSEPEEKSDEEMESDSSEESRENAD